MDMVQWICVFTILAAAVSYASWRIYKVLKRAENPCDSCDGCPLKAQKPRNKDFCKKK